MFKNFQLKNGMKVLLVESHKSPVVSIQMWVKTGSADEQKNEEGISHFIEHLVFKGTEKYGVGEIASIVEGSGGELNAYTSFDQTVFYVTISKQFMGTGLDVISQMMGYPKFDEDEVDNEREVVLEEIKRTNDNPHRQASRQLFSTIYKKHPYRLPVIGFEKVIKNVSVKKLKEYYHKRYVPENMTLVIAGDFDMKNIKQEVNTYFGDFESYPLKKIKRTKELVQEKTRIDVKKSSFQENLFYLAWRIPNARHKDIPALDVLAMILGQGDSSRLTKSLRIHKPLVNYIGASSYTPLDPGFFAISGSLNIEHLEEVYEVLLKEIEHLLSRYPEREELDKAVVNIESEEFYGLETVDGLARKVGTYHFLFDDYKYFNEFLKQIRQLTTKDIRRVAKKYLKAENLSVTVMTNSNPENVKKLTQSFVKKFRNLCEGNKLEKGQKEQKPKRRNWNSGGVEKISDSIEKIVLKSGAKVILRPNFDTPIVNLRAAYLGGLRFEPESKLGLTELLSRTWANSTKNLGETDFYHKVENMASQISAFGGRNTIGLSMTTLSPFAQPMRELFFEVLKHPNITDDMVEREKYIMEEKIKKKQDNPAQIAIQNCMSVLFKGHPYAKDMSGTIESIKGLTSRDVREYLKELQGAENLSLVLAGAFNKEEWLDYLQSETKNLPKTQLPKLDLKMQYPIKKEILFESSEKEQSHIIVAYPGLKFTDQQVYELQVLQSILAGQGGRLFIELRDKNSLAYSVSPLRMEGIEGGYFGTYIGCSPEKSQKAIAMMKQELKKLADELVSNEELQRSKRYLIGRHDIELQKTSSVAASILFDDIYGVGYLECFKFAEKINAVTADQVKELAKKLFAQPEIISCVGPLNPFESTSKKGKSEPSPQP